MPRCPIENQRHTSKRRRSSSHTISLTEKYTTRYPDNFPGKIIMQLEVEDCQGSVIVTSALSIRHTTNGNGYAMSTKAHISGVYWALAPSEFLPMSISSHVSSIAGSIL